MKTHLLPLFAIGLIAALLPLVSCNPFGGDDNIVRVTKDITTPTTWYGDTIYVIEDSDFWVDATLTIQPGTIVKFRPSGGAVEGQLLTLDTGGRIIADGTPTSPIIFTSYYDDAHGGDTNGDGNATSSASKDWQHIETNGAHGSTFDYCEFYYGGGGTYRDTLGISYGSDAVTVTNCVFAHNDGGIVGNLYYGALDAAGGASGVIIENNLFYDNNLPLSISDYISIDDTNVFENPDPPNEINTFNGIFVYAGLIESAISWTETEVAFVINNADWWIGATGSLTLADGVVLKFTELSGLTLDTGAVLNNYDGTGVAFTSFYDDSRLGDTNGDGYSEGLANDWEGIAETGSGYLSWPNIYFDSH